MKRYKLKRELPKYSIGTEFILEDEALVLEDGEGQEYVSNGGSPLSHSMKMQGTGQVVGMNWIELTMMAIMSQGM